MTTNEIANELVTLLRQGKFDEVYDNLYHPEKIHHVEPQSEYFPDLTGIEALRAKDSQIMPNVEKMENLKIGDPIVVGNHIALTYNLDITLKDGNKMSMDEIIVYKVEDGKITLEHFFY